MPAPGRQFAAPGSQDKDDDRVTGWQRRDFVKAAALLALAYAMPAAAADPLALDPASAPAPRRIALLRTLAQMVIPRTDTPGAGEVGAGDFVLLALAHGLEGTGRPVAAPAEFAAHRRKDGMFDHAGWIEAELDRRAGGDFLTLAASAQAEHVAALDREAFAAPAWHPWKPLKTLILTGYYTSEAGASQELRYELIPGRWDPDLPATGETRAFSSDWTAVDFG